MEDRELSLLALLPRIPEGAHAEVQKQQGEAARKKDLAGSGAAGGVAVVLANGGADPDQREHQEEQSRDLQPQGMQHPAEGARGDAARIVKGADPAILAGLTASDAEHSAG